MKLLILFLLSPIICCSQIITTIAGNGNASYSGDNNLATSAGVYFPVSVCTDSSGNIFIAEQLDHRIRKVNLSTGIISTIVGTGIAGYNGDSIISQNAQLNYPIGIIIDSIDNLYIADGNNNRIRKVSTNGIITTIAGTGVAGYNGDSIQAMISSIYSPTGITIDRYGSILFSDNHNNRVRKITTNGIISTIAGSGLQGYYGDNGLANIAQINSPIGINVDTVGNFYFIDYNNSRVRKVSITNNVISTICGTGINGYNSDGIVSIVAQLNQPRSVAIDKYNNILIADSYNNRIRKINMTTGIISTIAGTGIAGFSGDGCTPTSAMLKGPSYIYVDRYNDYYITDGANHRVRKIINSFPIIAIPSNIVCSGTPVTYEADVVAACISPSYQWIVNGVNVGTNTSTYTYTPINGDTILCLMTCACGANINSRPIRMTVNNMSPAISLSSPNNALLNSLVTLSATVTNAGSSYTIYWMNHGVIFATTNVPPATGNSATYTKGVGTDSLSAKVVVTGGGCYDSAITPTISTVTTTTGISLLTNNSNILVYPNPVRDLLYISTTEAQNYMLYTVIGKAIQQGAVTKNGSIDMKAIPTGTYLLQLTNIHGQREVIRVVKE